MTNFTTQLISAAFQIALFLAIPFIWWLVRGASSRASSVGSVGTRPRSPNPGSWLRS